MRTYQTKKRNRRIHKANIVYMIIKSFSTNQTGLHKKDHQSQMYKTYKIKRKKSETCSLITTSRLFPEITNFCLGKAGKAQIIIVENNRKTFLGLVS